ncbi:hypothetical protein [Thalassotalea fusca]
MLNASFVQSALTDLKYFQLSRVCKPARGTVVFVQGLFEELNQNRHAFNGMAQMLTTHDFNTILYDAVGTGDSEGDLTDVSLLLWHNQLLEVVQNAQQQNENPVSIIVFGSGALLLTEEVLKCASHVQLWQPEFSGKRLAKNLGRLAILNQMPISEDDEIINVSGYQVPQVLWQSLKQNPSPAFASFAPKIEWFELIDNEQQQVPQLRQNLAQSVFGDSFSVVSIVQSKYWLANELIQPEALWARATTAIEARAKESAVE